MRVLIFENVWQVGLWVAEYMRGEIEAFKGYDGRRYYGLALPTGRTPLLTYKSLVALCDAGMMSFRDVLMFNLDEYVGLGAEDERSFAWFLHHHLIRHVDIPLEQVILFNGSNLVVDSKKLLDGHHHQKNERMDNNIITVINDGKHLINEGSRKLIKHDDVAAEVDVLRTNKISDTDTTRLQNKTHFPAKEKSMLTLSQLAASEAARIESKINDAGGLHLIVAGVGRDGHIGFNEPGSSLSSRTRIKTLSDETIQVNSAFAADDSSKSNHFPVQLPPLAITMGIATMMDADKIVIIAIGRSKALAVQAAVEGSVTHQWPVSAMQMHRNAILVCDEEASEELKVKTVRYCQRSENEQLIKFADVKDEQTYREIGLPKLLSGAYRQTQ